MGSRSQILVFIDSNHGKSKIVQCFEIWHTPLPYKLWQDQIVPYQMIPNVNRGYTPDTVLDSLIADD